VESLLLPGGLQGSDRHPDGIIADCVADTAAVLDEVVFQGEGHLSIFSEHLSEIVGEMVDLGSK
jgi:hypothetical protein